MREKDAPVLWNPGVALDHCVLDFGSAAHGVDYEIR